MNEDQAAELFKALSNPDRLKIIRALVVAGPNGMSAGEIAKQVNASPSRASFHLSALSDAGYVQQSREARSLIYTVDFSRIAALVGFLMEDCCGGQINLSRCCT